VTQSSILTPMDCIFCRIIRGEIPAEPVLEDEEFLAIRDINPKARVHVLAMPKEHIPSLDHIGAWDPDRAGRLLAFLVKVADALGIRGSGYRVITNIGADSGQEVDHLHLHVMGGERLGEFH
jgi:histidine triad (HIT) family protein